jgi:hypothetical protein
VSDAVDPQDELDRALEQLKAASQLSAPDALGLVANILDFAGGASARADDNGAHLYRLVSDGFREAAADASPDAKTALNALGEFWGGVAEEREARTTGLMAELEPTAWSLDFQQTERTQLRFRDTSAESPLSFELGSERGLDVDRPEASEATSLTQNQLRRKAAGD